MRVKEEENDYRYFPDPDLVPMTFEAARIEGLREALPELPLAKIARYEGELGLSAKESSVLIADLDWAAFFEEAVALGGEPKAIWNWMNSDFAGRLNDRGLSARQSKVGPAHLVDLTNLIASG